MWTVHPLPWHYDQNLHLAGNIPAPTLPGMLAPSWWDGCISFLIEDCRIRSQKEPSRQ